MSNERLENIAHKADVWVRMVQDVRGGNRTPSGWMDERIHRDMEEIKHHAEAINADLEAERARSTRYRAAYEAEFRYNMELLLPDRDGSRLAETAQAALDAWRELKRHGDPVQDWKGYGDLPESEATE